MKRWLSFFLIFSGASLYAAIWQTTVQEHGITYTSSNRNAKITQISIIRTSQNQIEFIFYTGVSAALRFNPPSYTMDVIEAAFAAVQNFDSDVLDFRTEARIVFETPHATRRVNNEFLLLHTPRVGS